MEKGGYGGGRIQRLEFVEERGLWKRETSVDSGLLFGGCQTLSPSRRCVSLLYALTRCITSASGDCTTAHVDLLVCVDLSTLFALHASACRARSAEPNTWRRKVREEGNCGGGRRPEFVEIAGHGRKNCG